MRAIDLAGRAFGRLTVVARAGSTSSRPCRPLWHCRCTCGNEPIVLGASLLAGRTRSCGCLRAELARSAVGAARAQRWHRARDRSGRERQARREEREQQAPREGRERQARRGKSG